MKELLIIAGEASGDLHGASLIRELKTISPEIHITGIGGAKMENAGMELLFHIKEMAFLGFAEVIKHLPFIKKVRNRILLEVSRRHITTAVLIDYPGFNLNIAKKLKKMGVNVVYYISPQIWAWGQGRISKIRKYVDKMIVILPFEEQFFSGAGVDVQYVGHPLMEQVSNYNFGSKEEFYKTLNLQTGKDIVLVLPGSREQEIKRIFPEVISAAEKLAGELNLQVIVACSSNIDSAVFARLSACSNYSVIKDHTYDLMKYSKFGIIKSGTSTLEAALFSLPMVIVYATNRLTYMIGRRLIKIKNIGLVNIVAGRTIVDELIQDEVNSQKIYEVSKEIIMNQEKYERIKKDLDSLADLLGGKGASGKAAQIVYGFLSR